MDKRRKDRKERERMGDKRKREKGKTNTKIVSESMQREPRLRRRAARMQNKYVDVGVERC